jgi:flagellin
MKIAYNASAVLANNALFRNDQRLSKTLQRLSSGLKLTAAKDNPAGMAMGRRMKSQLEGMSVAHQNSNDAISVIEIADGAMMEVHDIMQRINELAVKANNEILMEVDRKMIQDEVASLKLEITRIANTTEFNGQRILDGSFDLKGYTYDVGTPAGTGPGSYVYGAVDVKVTGYSDYVKTGMYWLDTLDVKFDYKGNIVFDADTTFTSDEDSGTTPPRMKLPDTANISSVDGNVITITADRGFELKLEVRIQPEDIPDTGTVQLNFTDILVDVVGFGSMDTQVGANEGQQLDIRIYRLSLENMGISNIDLSTEEGARDALTKMGPAINYVSTARSHMGAYQNRLEHTISNLDTTTENLTAAYSRIMDTDMAEEMTEYTTLQILVQASTSMLAQANERPATVLQLLQ